MHPREALSVKSFLFAFFVCILDLVLYGARGMRSVRLVFRFGTLRQSTVPAAAVLGKVFNARAEQRAQSCIKLVSEIEPFELHDCERGSQWTQSCGSCSKIIRLY